MPKIKRWYYQRAKRISDSAINIIQSIQHQSSASLRKSSSLSNNISLSFESDSAEVNAYSGTSERVNNESSDFEENEPINHSASNNCDDEVINFIDTDPNSVSLVDDSSNFVSWFQEWAIRNRISHVALNELMKSIKPKYPELPSDARSLLRTPRKVNVKDVKRGQYYHFGLQNCIEQLVSQYSVQLSQIVKVNINIDGLPLFKSSTSQVYPILCNLVENYDLVNVIGIYYGDEKPSDANEFLTDFVEEAITLSKYGIQINNEIYQFKINAFICDVPAKAFITFTKGHSGYYSCTKCTAKGVYILNDRVMTYPYSTSNSHPLRTNDDFKSKLQPEHHTGSSWTVVKFIDEDSVEAVPTKWIFNEKCYWPPFKLNKLKAAIKKNEDLNTHWPSYKVSIFRHSTFDDYSKAREKCKKAECTSELNSDTDEGIKKRMIKKRQIYSSSEEENYESDCRSLIPTPPLLKGNCEATVDIARSKTISKQVSLSEESSEFDLLCTTPSRIRELKRRKQVDAQQDSSNNNISFNNNNNISPNKENKNPSANFRDCTCSFWPAHAETQNQNETYFKEIIRQLGYIKTQLWQTNDDIQDIKTNGIIRSPPTDISRNESLFYSFTLPLQTEDQLQEVETFLKNTANMTTTIKQASRVGGKDCYDFIKRNLNQLLSNRLAEKYSLLGKKQKLAFRNLKLAELLIAAGEAHNEAFSNKDLEQAIQKWLRRAKERADAEEKKTQEEH